MIVGVVVREKRRLSFFMKYVNLHLQCSKNVRSYLLRILGQTIQQVEPTPICRISTTPPTLTGPLVITFGPILLR